LPGDLVDGHSGRVDNSVGMTVEMPRDKVNPDPNQTCSHGLHVAAPEYVRNHYAGDVIVECIVNPMDVCAVPNDYNNTKMRVFLYMVTGYANKTTRKPEKLVSLKDFVTDPTEIAQKAIESGNHQQPKDSGHEHTETVKSKSSKMITKASSSLEKIEGKSAKDIISFVQSETGELIEINVKNKTAIIKKAVELLDAFEEKRHEELQVKTKKGETKAITETSAEEVVQSHDLNPNIGHNEDEIVEAPIEPVVEEQPAVEEVPVDSALEVVPE